jgi:hypothetical protein
LAKLENLLDPIPQSNCNQKMSLKRLCEQVEETQNAKRQALDRGEQHNVTSDSPRQLNYEGRTPEERELVQKINEFLGTYFIDRDAMESCPVVIQASLSMHDINRRVQLIYMCATLGLSDPEFYVLPGSLEDGFPINGLELDLASAPSHLKLLPPSLCLSSLLQIKVQVEEMVGRIGMVRMRHAKLNKLMIDSFGPEAMDDVGDRMVIQLDTGHKTSLTNDIRLLAGNYVFDPDDSSNDYAAYALIVYYVIKGVVKAQSIKLAKECK